MASTRRLKPKHRRLIMVGLSLATLAVAAFLILRALNENVVFFYSPTNVVEKKPAAEQRFRIGGLVEEGSVNKSDGQARFRITDGAHTIDEIIAELEMAFQRTELRNDVVGFIEGAARHGWVQLVPP